MILRLEPQSSGTSETSGAGNVAAMVSPTNVPRGTPAKSAARTKTGRKWPCKKAAIDEKRPDRLDSLERLISENLTQGGPAVNNERRPCLFLF